MDTVQSPFSEQFLADMDAKEGMTLRDYLTLLRNEYDKVVFGKPVGDHGKPGQMTPITEEDSRAECSRYWHAAHGKAQRALQGSLITEFDAIHRGLGAIIEHGQPIAKRDCELRLVKALVRFGNDPRYEVVSRVEIVPRAGGTAHPVAIAFLLAQGRGMAADLAAKFGAFLPENEPVEALVILRPRPSGTGNWVTDLPGKTADTWHKQPRKADAHLKFISPEQLRLTHAADAWIGAVKEMAPQEDINSFLRDKCAPVVALLEDAIPWESFAHDPAN